MAATKKRGLGRGLDTLLGGGEEHSGEVREILQHLPVGSLQPGKYQPRQTMDQEKLEELAASIKAQGVIEPVVVRAIGRDLTGQDSRRTTELAKALQNGDVDVPQDGHAVLAEEGGERGERAHLICYQPPPLLKASRSEIEARANVSSLSLRASASASSIPWPTIRTSAP